MNIILNNLGLSDKDGETLLIILLKLRLLQLMILIQSLNI